MKQFLILCVMVLALSHAAFGFDTETVITLEQLPVMSRETIRKSFDVDKIAVVKKDEFLFLKTSYEVVFKDGTQVEFDQHGVWTELKGFADGIPQGIVPQAISDYVKKNYSGAKIIAMEREDDDSYEIKLSNRLELKFDNALKLIDIEKDDH